MTHDFRDIRDGLARNALALARELAPEGKRAGKYWLAKSPLRADRHAGSFWVIVTGPAAGTWRDEATMSKASDIVDLIIQVHGLADKKEARRWCLAWLGWSDAPMPGRAPKSKAEREAELAERLKREDAEEAERRARKAKAALAIFLSAQPLNRDTFPGSAMETYLKSRSLDLMRDLIGAGRPIPPALRFSPAQDYHTADGEVLTFPAIVSIMSGPDGRAAAVHRIWLKPDGGGKAELPEPKINKPRKILGNPKGAVIRIAKGASKLSPEKASAAGLADPLILCEGIEDGLALAISCPGHRVFAAGTLGNLANIPDFPCVSSFTVAADNDWGKPQAMRSLAEAVAALKRHGKPVNVARSFIGKDFNDLIKGELT